MGISQVWWTKSWEPGSFCQCCDRFHNTGDKLGCEFFLSNHTSVLVCHAGSRGYFIVIYRLNFAMLETAGGRFVEFAVKLPAIEGHCCYLGKLSTPARSVTKGHVSLWLWQPLIQRGSPAHLAPVPLELKRDVQAVKVAGCYSWSRDPSSLLVIGLSSFQLFQRSKRLWGSVSSACRELQNLQQGWALHLTSDNSPNLLTFFTQT